MLVPITALYAGALGLLMLVLASRVSAERIRLGASLGTDAAPSLLEAVRRHGNFVEWVPFILLLMASCELNGFDSDYLHVAGLTLLFGRVLHPFGIKHKVIPQPLRAAGTILTFGVALALSVVAMWQWLPSAQAQQTQQPQPVGTRLILLGTAGGPAIKKLRAQPANAVIVNGSVCIVDAGNGVARQMALADVPPQALRAVFITHLHSDHVADYGTLLLRAWQSGLKCVVDTYGPVPLAAMTVSYLQYMDWDIQLRIRDEKRPPFAGLVRAHNISGGGLIYQDENVKVTATEVPHDAAKPAYAYRFDTADLAIVFSGDTASSENLIKLAAGADILVHEVVNIDGVDATVNETDPGNEALKRHVIAAHTPIEEVGRVATQAKVKKRVLSHVVPTGQRAFDQPELWLQSVRKTYKGEVVVGEDLLQITATAEAKN